MASPVWYEGGGHYMLKDKGQRYPMFFGMRRAFYLFGMAWRRRERVFGLYDDVVAGR